MQTIKHVLNIVISVAIGLAIATIILAFIIPTGDEPLSNEYAVYSLILLVGCPALVLWLRYRGLQRT